MCSKLIPVFLLVYAALLAATFPTYKLYENTGSVNGSSEYILGHSDGCATGLNAAIVFRHLVTDSAFVKQDGVSTEDYKKGWNEGFTVCRFYQGNWNEWAFLGLIILTLYGTRCRCKKD